MNCIFCKIIEKEIPAHIVYEDEDFLAFLDAVPVRMGHTLVIPKKHDADFTKLDEDTYTKLMNVVHKIAQKMEKEIAPLKVGMMIQGFDVAHVHVHIIPLEDAHDISTRRISDRTNSTKEFEEMSKLLHM